ncbi:metallophosphoesterase [Flavobacteriaceae bacterium]|nr:metallophosphoesterase [Flavobacteriaceae bacterium]
MFYALIDFYAYQALKTITKHPWAPWIYFGTSLIVLGLFLGQLLSMGEARHTLPGGLYFFGLFLAFFVPKFLIGTFLLTEDLVRIIWGISRQFVAQPETFLPGRRRFVSNVAMITAALPFGALLYGMFRGKYQYQVLTYTLTFDDLPEAFDGYTIAHISDIHCGSFDDDEKVAYGISLVNEQNADLILFTGDLVNNRADELDRWQGVLGNLTAPDGVYSVLGNHDYGDYVPWASTEEKAANLNDLKGRQAKIGWQLLLNEHITIKRDEQELKLIGVENWGKGGFKKSGDFQAATQGIDPESFKILMSHDPSHWEHQIKDHPMKVHLTLSGHTHGMQFGVDIPGLIKWSPVQYRYPFWAGIYKRNNKFLNVNRGFGFIGYPGRVGIKPEVSVIQLKKGPKPA